MTSVFRLRGCAAPADKSRVAAQAEYSPMRRMRKNTRETANERSE